MGELKKCFLLMLLNYKEKVGRLGLRILILRMKHLHYQRVILFIALSVIRDILLIIGEQILFLLL